MRGGEQVLAWAGKRLSDTCQLAPREQPDASINGAARASSIGVVWFGGWSLQKDGLASTLELLWAARVAFFMEQLL